MTDTHTCVLRAGESSKGLVCCCINEDRVFREQFELIVLALHLTATEPASPEQMVASALSGDVPSRMHPVRRQEARPHSEEELRSREGAELRS